MKQERVILAAAYTLAVIALVAGASLVIPAIAAEGDIIISREVQPRAAVRKELAADPNPQLVNPKPNAVIEIGLRGNRAVGELDDNEFAAVITGTRLSTGLLSSQIRVADPVVAGSVPLSVGAGHNVVGHGGSGGLGNIDDRINHSVQQGLRPLQILQR
ncbi:MAG: hypothetical protein JKY26_18165 [Pseudomonas sp.]|nr:hypothetical protein [Pseudomonas sp.]